MLSPKQDRFLDKATRGSKSSGPLPLVKTKRSRTLHSQFFSPSFNFPGVGSVLHVGKDSRSSIPRAVWPPFYLVLPAPRGLAPFHTAWPRLNSLPGS